jgi:hypothetical protein
MQSKKEKKPIHIMGTHTKGKAALSIKRVRNPPIIKHLSSTEQAKWGKKKTSISQASRGFERVRK